MRMHGVSWRDLEDLRALPTGSDVRRQAFRRLAVRCHPDKVTSAEEKAEATRLFQELLAARDGDEDLGDLSSLHQQETFADSCRLCALPQRDVVHGVAFARGGRRVAACGDSGRVMLWSAVTGLAAEGWCPPKRDAQLEDGNGTTLAVAFLDDEYLAAASGTSVLIWEVDGANDAPKYRLDLDARVMSLAVEPPEHRLACGLETGRVLIWRWQEGHDQYCLESSLKHDAAVECVVFANFEATFLLSAGGASLLLWRHCGRSWTAWARLGSWRCPDFIYSVDVIGSVIAAGGTGATVPVWSVTADCWKNKSAGSNYSSSRDSGDVEDTEDDSDAEEEQTLVSSPDLEVQSPDVLISHCEDTNVAVNAVSVCPGGRCLATGGSDCRIVIWQLPGLSETLCSLATFVHRLPPGGCNLATAAINHLRISPDGAVLAAGGYDMMLTLWRLPVPAPIQDQTVPSPM